MRLGVVVGAGLLFMAGCSGSKGGASSSTGKSGSTGTATASANATTAASSSGSSTVHGSSSSAATSSSGTTATSSSSASSSTAASSSGSATSSGSSGGSSGSSCVASAGFCTTVADCCAGLGCFANVCSCGGQQGDSCAGGVACCGGLTCDSTEHCQPACSDAGSCSDRGQACAADADCCHPATCQGGTCAIGTEPTAACQQDGQACATQADCCGADAGQLACVSAGDGGSVCHLGQFGETCDSTRPCESGLDCIVTPPASSSVSSASSATASSAAASSSSSSSTASSSSASSSGALSSSSGAATSSSSSAAASSSSGGGSTVSSSSSGATTTSSSSSGGTSSSTASSSSSSSSGALSVGVCGVPSYSPTRTCSVVIGTCKVGYLCDPNGAVNRGADPCFYNGNFTPREDALACIDGVCQMPPLGYGCGDFYGCAQAPGDSRPTICAYEFDGSQVCRPGCTGNDQCPGASITDQGSYAPQPQDEWCIDYGNVDANGMSTGPACVRGLCYYPGAFPDAGLGPSNLYQPCPNLPNSLCEPEYYGSDTTEIGFCQSVQPTSASTVGQLCDEFAGREDPTAICGSDAFCLGGICQPLCDAVEGGTKAGVPGCTDATLTCISPEGINPVSSYQVGGCGVACDPYADMESSGCANFCGGPPSRCGFIFADGETPSVPAGYCEAALTPPIAPGQPCTQRSDGQEQCASGAACFATFPDAGGQTCLKLCLAAAPADSPDACPSGSGGSTCTLLNGFAKTGVCL